MKNIAIISARSGSKGLPDKNIKELYGKPLMAYSIETALNSGCFDSVMVSTDSEHYAQIAREYGAEVPFLRSEATSSDVASSWDAVEEVLQGYEKKGRIFDTFCLLQPTSPMRTSEDIKNAYNLYEEKNAVAVLSMTELEHPIEWCGRINDTLSLEEFHKKHEGDRRQDMGKSYRPNGAIYIVSVDEFRRDRNLYRAGSYAYIMPQERSVDIDTEQDFKYAEFLKEINNGSNRNPLSEYISIKEELFNKMYASNQIDQASDIFLECVMCYERQVRDGFKYDACLSRLLLSCVTTDAVNLNDILASKSISLSDKEAIKIREILRPSLDIVHKINNPPEYIIVDEDYIKNQKFSELIYNDLIETQGIVEECLRNAVDDDQGGKIITNEIIKNKIDSISSVKPSRVSETPFQFIEEDPLIACVGNNGGTSNYDIFEGFVKAVSVIYESVARNRLYEDAMVYPMAFSARHGIELGLKISIHELKDFLDLDKLDSRIVNLDRKLIESVLLEHNIKALRDCFVSLLAIDKRLSIYASNMTPYLSDYYFDEKGDMFRYAKSRDEVLNLASQNINHVGLTQLHKRFFELVKWFEKFYSEIEIIYSEYKTGSYTKRLSREDIKNIADKLPDKSQWTETAFDDIRNEIKSEYGIGSKELSDAVSIIKSVPEFSAKIGMEKKYKDISGAELDSYWKLVEWYNSKENSVPDTISISGITVETINQIQQNLRGSDKYAKDISTETLNILLAFYLIAYEDAYVEDMDKYYSFVQKSRYDRNYLVRKLARADSFNFVKIGMEKCGQKSYLKRIDYTLA